MFTAVSIVAIVGVYSLMGTFVYHHIQEYRHAKEALNRAKAYCPYNYEVRTVHENRVNEHKEYIIEGLILLGVFTISVIVLGV